MMQVTMALIDIIQEKKSALDNNTTPDSIIAFAREIVENFVKHTYNVEEARLLHNELKDLSRYAMHQGYYNLDVNNYVLTSIAKFFYPLDYRVSREDAALTGIHTIYDNLNADDLMNTLTNKMPPINLFYTVQSLTSMMNKLQSGTFKQLLMTRLHDAMLANSMNDGVDADSVTEICTYYMKIAGLLGFYTPGTPDEDVFLAKCKTYVGVAVSNNYDNELNISAKDIYLANKGSTDLFGGV